MLLRDTHSHVLEYILSVTANKYVLYVGVYVSVYAVHFLYLHFYIT